MHAVAAAILLVLGLVATPVLSQPIGEADTVVEARTVRIGAAVTLTGTIVDHLKGSQFVFRDETGEMRVQVSPGLWRGLSVTTETRLRLTGAVDRSFGGRYLWVKSLEVLP